MSRSLLGARQPVVRRRPLAVVSAWAVALLVASVTSLAVGSASASSGYDELPLTYDEAIDLVRWIDEEVGPACTEVAATELMAPSTRLALVRLGSDFVAPNTTRDLFDVRAPNPDHPPLARVVDEFDNLCTHPNYDCSEIAEDLLAAAGEGRILRFEPSPGSTLRVPEAGGNRIREFVYHEVFTDGRYVYDPRFSEVPVPLGDYNRMMSGLNPG